MKIALFVHWSCFTNGGTLNGNNLPRPNLESKGQRKNQAEVMHQYFANNVISVLGHMCVVQINYMQCISQNVNGGARFHKEL